jgi:hypothetical protein
MDREWGAFASYNYWEYVLVLYRVIQRRREKNRKKGRGIESNRKNKYSGGNRDEDVIHSRRAQQADEDDTKPRE